MTKPETVFLGLRLRGQRLEQVSWEPKRPGSLVYRELGTISEATAELKLRCEVCADAVELVSHIIDRAPGQPPATSAIIREAVRFADILAAANGATPAGVETHRRLCAG